MSFSFSETWGKGMAGGIFQAMIGVISDMKKELKANAAAWGKEVHQPGVEEE